MDVVFSSYDPYSLILYSIYFVNICISCSCPSCNIIFKDWPHLPSIQLCYELKPRHNIVSAQVVLQYSFMPEERWHMMVVIKVGDDKWSYDRWTEWQKVLLGTSFIQVNGMPGIVTICIIVSIIWQLGVARVSEFGGSLVINLLRFRCVLWFSSHPCETDCFACPLWQMVLSVCIPTE